MKHSDKIKAKAMLFSNKIKNLQSDNDKYFNAKQDENEKEFRRILIFMMAIAVLIMLYTASVLIFI